MAACTPWLKLSDTELRGLMFGNTVTRAWQVHSDGFCPSCGKVVLMFGWQVDAWAQPWKVSCPHCQEKFPKNDFAAFYRSGLDADGIFRPERADRSLLSAGIVDDGEGYIADGKRLRFIGYYLIRGQWWQVVIAGIRNLAAAYVLTGDAEYGRRAGVMLERVAELYPTFDFNTQAEVYQQRGSRGYVTIWHNACFDAYMLAIAFDQVFACLTAQQREKITAGILLDTIAHREKIDSNYPATDAALIALHLVLGNRTEALALLDPVIETTTAVDGVTGEKGITGYACHGPADIARVLVELSLLDEDVMRELFKRHPQLHKLYRFHIDTWCLEKYYPRVGDDGYFGKPSPLPAGVPWASDGAAALKVGVPALQPSMFTLFWRLYELTGDAAFVQTLYHANGRKLDGLPHDVFCADPVAFQRRVKEVIEREGAELKLQSVDFPNWHLAILRSGKTAAWVSYDSWGKHGHASGMNLGLYAHGLDLMADNGYPPVQFEGFKGTRFNWHWSTAAHNTVVVDGRNQCYFEGKTTLWEKGDGYQVMRVEPDMKPVTLDGEYVAFYMHTRGVIQDVRINGQAVNEWKVLNGEYQIANGRLTGSGLIMCTRRFPGNQRVEYRAQTDDPKPCDLSCVLSMHEAGLETGAYFGFGSHHNQFSIITFDFRPARWRGAGQSEAKIVPGKLHHVVAEHDGKFLRHWVDGALTMEVCNDGLPHIPGPVKRYARTILLADAGYVVDWFDVAGGSDHAKFVHTFHGPVTPEGLKLQPGPEYGHGTLMRNFRRDPNPAPGWSVDWHIENNIHLRYTDLTDGAEANLCEGWIMKRAYETDEETWINRVMVRRQASESLFVAVIEPYAGQSNIGQIRRQGNRVEIDLRNGRRDVVEWDNPYCSKPRITCA